MIVVDYQPNYCASLADIFIKAILAVDDTVYNPAQKIAWLGNHSAEFWQNRFAKSLPKVAIYQGQVVGFIEFDTSLGKAIGEIDCFYIAPNFQRQGVGQALFDEVVKIARQNNISQIMVYASHIAKPFFERQDFSVVQKNTIEKSGILLENWLLSLNL